MPYSENKWFFSVIRLNHWFKSLNIDILPQVSPYRFHTLLHSLHPLGLPIRLWVIYTVGLYCSLCGYGTISGDFFIKKRFQLVKTIRLSTHNEIFEGKKFKIFFGVVGKKNLFFSIYDEKSAENFILGIHLVEKCLIRGVLTNFCKNVPFWGPYLSWKHFSYSPLYLSRQGASFKHPHDYFLSDYFSSKKSGKIGWNSKFLSKSS